MKKPAPADAPSTLKDPDYAKRQRARLKAEKDRYDELCGPVVVTAAAGQVTALGVPRR